MFDEKIKIICKDKDLIIQPIESLWNEIRHTRSTIAYIRSLVESDRPNKNFLHRWSLEVDKLQNKLISLNEKFSKAYISVQCILQEFEEKKFDRCYLEIAFLKTA